MSTKVNIPTEKDFIKAINEMGTYIDVTPGTLVELTEKAMKYASLRQLKSVQVNTVTTTSIITISSNSHINNAITLMMKHRISGLPVVDSHEKLVGLITEADVLRAIGLPFDRPTQDVWDTLSSMFHHFTVSESNLNLKDEDITVSDVMSEHIITTSSYNNIDDVLQLMQKHKIKRVLVTDTDNRVKGIVSRSDLMKVILDAHLP